MSYDNWKTDESAWGGPYSGERWEIPEPEEHADEDEEDAE